MIHRDLVIGSAGLLSVTSQLRSRYRCSSPSCTFVEFCAQDTGVGWANCEHTRPLSPKAIRGLFSFGNNSLTENFARFPRHQCVHIVIEPQPREFRFPLDASGIATCVNRAARIYE